MTAPVDADDGADLDDVPYEVRELLVVLDLFLVVLDRFLHLGAFVVEPHGFGSHDLVECGMLSGEQGAGRERSEGTGGE